MATIPKVTVEVAFDGGPFSPSYSWTDVSDYVKGFQVKRGRNNELDRIEAGTLSLSLDNSDGRFTPGKRKAGTNLLAAFSSLVTVDMTTAPQAAEVSSISVGAIADDGKPRFMSRTVYTNGQPVSCYFAVKWLDAGGATLSFPVGTRFVADSSPAVYTHEDTPPAGTASAVLYIFADTYPEGKGAGPLLMYAENAEWYNTQPYYPNVVPRRRVRVRTPNLTPKDVSTGGDVSRMSLQFSTSHSPGTTNRWVDYPKSGAGSIRVDLGNNGTADFASSVRCGFTTGGKPVGVAKVVPGQVYSARAQVRLGQLSPALSMVMVVRWYDANGTFIQVSADSPTVALATGTWKPITRTGITSPANAMWAGISIGTRGGDGGGTGYFFIDEVQLEQGATLSEWNPGGSIFHGYIEKWPVTSEGLTATVDVSAVDGFSVLSSTAIRSAMQSHILTLNPLGYWTLGDPVGSTRIENLVNDKEPAKLLPSKYGPGTALLGADSVVRKDDTTCYSLANVASNQGTVVDICDNGNRWYNLELGGELSVSFWCHPVYPSAGQTVTMFRSWADNGFDQLKVQLDSSGKLTASTLFMEGTSSATSNASVSSSAPTFVVVTVKDGLTSIWLNGSLDIKSTIGTVMDARLRPMRWSSLGGAQAGSVYAEYANGRYGHLALWTRQLASSEISAVWKLGDYSGNVFSEDERTRIDRIASMAAYQGETSLDNAKSTLQGPDWSTGASALEELQRAAEDASGYVFMDGDGRLTYHNRDRRQGAVVRYELSDTLGLPYEPGLQFEMDEDRIVNEVTYRRPTGIEGVLKDQSSIDSYGRKSKSIELRVTSDAAVQDAAYTLLNHYSVPVVRCDSVTLKASAAPALFLPVLGVEIGDRIKLSDLPSQAPSSSLDYYVEAIGTDVSVDGGTLDWVTTLSLSPGENSNVWVLEDPTLGRLDQTSVLAY
ncbi:LamG-like jellyroll fold domain-containing protein [Streptomyces sp. NPDC058682]|uniref:LamG-like jellyroll fold domain-containing protein n=1 Tax=Streptomyces sp. NPDC058682 TaxID=3346596 RepID=UPI0036604915